MKQDLYKFIKFFKYNENDIKIFKNNFKNIQKITSEKEIKNT